MIGAGKKFVRTDHEVCTAALHLQDTAQAGIFMFARWHTCAARPPLD